MNKNARKFSTSSESFFLQHISKFYILKQSFIRMSKNLSYVGTSSRKTTCPFFFVIQTKRVLFQAFSSNKKPTSNDIPSLLKRNRNLQRLIPRTKLKQSVYQRTCLSSLFNPISDNFFPAFLYHSINGLCIVKSPLESNTTCVAFQTRYEILFSSRSLK